MMRPAVRCRLFDRVPVWTLPTKRSRPVRVTDGRILAHIVSGPDSDEMAAVEFRFHPLDDVEPVVVLGDPKVVHRVPDAVNRVVPHQPATYELTIPNGYLRALLRCQLLKLTFGQLLKIPDQIRDGPLQVIGNGERENIRHDDVSASSSNASAMCARMSA